MRGSFACALLLAGCFTQQPGDGVLKCNPSGSRACPSGFTCATDGTCWRNGHSPSSADLSIVSDDMAVTFIDLAGVDLTGLDLSTVDLTGVDLGPTVKHQGESCGDGDICDTGHCVDSICCDTTCDGQCQACNLAVPGTCATVTSGSPRGSRPPCGGAGSACAGTCDSSSATACGYPSSATVCGASCNGQCDGAGGCSSSGPGTCPNGFACGVGACLTSCGGNLDCQPNFQCVAPNCVRITESDCLDGADNNGDGLADCQDPTCNTQVTCTAAPPGGDQVGIYLPSSSPCPTNFDTAILEHQNLFVPSACANCSCQATLTCSLELDITSNPGCGVATILGSAQVTRNYTTGSESDNCANFTATSGTFLEPVGPTLVSSSCIQGGSTTVPSPLWNTSIHFCPVLRSSNTCGANALCVARTSAADSICVRIPGGGSCPSGYTGGTSVNWFETFTDNRNCPACTCTKSGSPACGSSCFETFSMSGCSSSNEVEEWCGFNNGSCITRTNGSLSVASFNWFTGGNGTPPTCSVDPGTGTAVPSPSPAATICCPTCACASPPCKSLACPSGDFCDGAACQTCNTLHFCGGACSDCSTQRADTCQGGTTCQCGTNAPCNSSFADACTSGQCTCGGGPSCDGTSGVSWSCTGGQCKCSGMVCDRRYTDNCSGGSCKCGTNGPCSSALADNCNSGSCQCGTIPACSMSGSGTKACVSGQCQCNGSACVGDGCDATNGCACGVSVGCNPATADRCNSGVCKCGTNNACNGGKSCVAAHCV